jgi:hypothetical protein
MAGRRCSVAVVTATVLLSGCRDAPAAPACEALVRVARQSAACDAALEPLAQAVQREPDELACRLAVRRVLAGPQARPLRVRSVWAPDPAEDSSPLSSEEIASLSASTWPAQLLVVPDIPPGPGVPPTSGQLDETALDPDEHGRLHGHLPPGPTTLLLRHAGREAVYCVELRSCETLRITAHGDRLARHPDVRPGPC